MGAGVAAAAALICPLAAASVVGASADAALVESILEQTGASERRQGPGWGAYLEHLIASAVGSSVGELGDVVPRFARVVFALLVAVLAVLTVVSHVSRLRRPWEATADEPLVAVATTIDGARADTAPDTWKAGIGGALRSGDVALALEALWWWLATSVAGERADASWTSRELLATSGRHDLDQEVRALDQLAFGEQEPSPESIRDLVRRLEAEL